MYTVVIILISIAVMVDISSFVLGVRRMRGDGPSGAPLIGLFVFAIAMGIAYVQGFVNGDLAERALIAYSIFHVATNFLILLLLHCVLRLFNR